MKLVVFLAASACLAQAPRREPLPVKVEIGPGKAITITVPRMAKGDLLDIAAAFFSRGQEEQIPKLRKVLSEGSDITLILTSK